MGGAGHDTRSPIALDISRSRELLSKLRAKAFALLAFPRKSSDLSLLESFVAIGFCRMTYKRRVSSSRES